MRVSSRVTVFPCSFGRSFFIFTLVLLGNLLLNIMLNLFRETPKDHTNRSALRGVWKRYWLLPQHQYPVDIKTIKNSNNGQCTTLHKIVVQMWQINHVNPKPSLAFKVEGELNKTSTRFNKASLDRRKCNKNKT